MSRGARRLDQSINDIPIRDLIDDETEENPVRKETCVLQYSCPSESRTKNEDSPRKNAGQTFLHLQQRIPGRAYIALLADVHTVLSRLSACYSRCHVFHAKSTSRGTRSNSDTASDIFLCPLHLTWQICFHRSNSVMCSDTFRLEIPSFSGKAPASHGAGSTFLRRIPPRVMQVFSFFSFPCLFYL